jgi:hypothetical protein
MEVKLMIGIVRNDCIHDPDAATAKQYYRMGQLFYECTFLNPHLVVQLPEFNCPISKKDATDYISGLMEIKNSLRIEWIKNNPSAVPPWMKEGEVSDKD